MDLRQYTNDSLEDLRRKMTERDSRFEFKRTPVPKEYMDKIRQGKRIAVPKKKQLPLMPFSESKLIWWGYMKEEVLKGKRYVSTKSKDEKIQDVIKYFSGDSSTSYDLEKGMCFMGPLGTGKTVNMRAMLRILECRGKKVLESVTDNLCEEVIEHGINHKNQFNNYERFFDDLGNETSPIYNQYGNKVHVMASIMSRRYERFKTYGQRTYATMNMDEDQLENYLGPRVYDRFRSMMNFVEMGGESLR